MLFNTFNSKFEPHYIDTFREKVVQRSALELEHRFVRRGRMGGQISPKEMLRTIDEDWSLMPPARAGNQDGDDDEPTSHIGHEWQDVHASTASFAKAQSQLFHFRTTRTNS